MKVLVTGSSGLIGSEAVIHFDREGHLVFGIDNNMRRELWTGGRDVVEPGASEKNDPAFLRLNLDM